MLVNKGDYLQSQLYLTKFFSKRDDQSDAILKYGGVVRKQTTIHGVYYYHALFKTLKAAQEAINKI